MGPLTAGYEVEEGWLYQRALVRDAGVGGFEISGFQICEKMRA
jgi:hypothetical protein